MNPYELVREKKIIFLTGKGGVGKTLFTGVLGLIAQNLQKSALLVESVSRSQLAPLFDLPYADHQEQKISSLLSCINLTAQGNLKDFITKHLLKMGLFEHLISNNLVRSFLNAVPGLAELLLLGRIFYAKELAPHPRPEIILVDSYASGHFLSLMTTPQAVIDSGLGGPLVRETTRILDFLKDAKNVAVIHVAHPEDLVISETLEFLELCQLKSPVKPTLVILNKMLRAESLQRFQEGLKGLPAPLPELPVVCARDLGAISEPINSTLLAELGFLPAAE